MNDPMSPLLEQVKFMGEHGFDYLELTVEYQEATPDKLSSMEDELKGLLSTYNLDIVGHMPWFFEIANPYDGIRKAVVEECVKAVEAAARYDMPIMTIHPDILSKNRNEEKKMRATIESLSRISSACTDNGMRLCLENLDEKVCNITEMTGIFNAVPELGFTFDIGHANMNPDQGIPFQLVKDFSDRLAHVHAHDNRGTDDEHLPIGAGHVNWHDIILALKKVGYDGRVTLEIHARDKDYLLASRDKLWEIWENVTV